MWAERQRSRPALTSVTRAVASVDPIQTFAAANETEDRYLWLRPETGEALVGIGGIRAFEATGPDRFASIKAAWQTLLEDADTQGGKPRLLGGFSFDPLRARTSLWSGYPDARFVLPERMLTITGNAAWLTRNALTQTSAHTAQTSVPAEHRANDVDWKALVAETASGIRHADIGVDKVVLARAETVATRTRAEDAVRNLAQAYPTCTIFAIARGTACFVGATPERLVALHHGTASTMALAGSCQRGATPDEDAALAERLRNDPKERAEHAFVVNALRDGLAANDLCTRIVADAEPRVRTLANVHHLYTPIRGQVAPGRNALDLVQSLHPSPAVGGSPRDRALELIRAREGLDRGWYAGALGWIDSSGGGDFVVGIRSALLRHDSATLFAGCGIVADSNADSEYAESVWKLRPMAQALGVELQ